MNRNLIAIGLVAGLLFTGSTTLAAPPVDDEAPVQVRVADTTFEEAMYRTSDLRLRGLNAYETVPFTVPRGWELTEDPQVHLYMAHSDTLMPQTSSLTLLVNDTAVASVALDPDNAVDGVWEVTIPRDLLQPYNRLTLAAEHANGQVCEDPFDPSLWTRVSNRSFIRWEYSDKPLETELAAFPYPIFDDREYGPLELSLVGTPRVSEPTAKAAIRLAQGLGRVADYRAVRIGPAVMSVEEATGPALMIGTLSELPSLPNLLEAPQLRAGEGFVTVVPNPIHPEHPVLVITGTTGESLMSAVNALVAEGPSQVLAGREAIIYETLDGPLLASKRKPTPVAGKQRFTFEDVGTEDATVRGFYAPAVNVPLRFEGDAAVHRYGLEAAIHYGYGAMLDTSLSTMEVRLNGVTVDSVQLDHEEGQESVWHRLKIPSQVVTPHSELQVVFNLFPKDYEVCDHHSERLNWASVYANSELNIPRDGVAQVPDLARLRYDAWPFTLDGEKGSTVLVLPDQPTRGHLSVAFEMASHLGAMSLADAPALQVTTASSWAAGEFDDAHAIIFATGEDNTALARIRQQRALGLDGLPQGSGGRENLPYMQELVSPFGKNRLLLVLDAPTRDGLTQLVRKVSDPAEVVDLELDVAVLVPNDEVKVMQRSVQTQFGQLSFWGWLRGLPLENYWVLIALGLVGVLVVASGAVRAFARRRGGVVG